MTQLSRKRQHAAITPDAAAAPSSSPSSLSSSADAAKSSSATAVVSPAAAPSPSLGISVPCAAAASPPRPAAAAAATPHLPAVAAAAATRYLHPPRVAAASSSASSGPRTSSSTSFSSPSVSAVASSAAPASSLAAAAAAVTPPPPPPGGFAAFGPASLSFSSASAAAEAPAAEPEFPGILEGETDAAERHFPRSEAQRVRDCIKRLCGWTGDAFPGGHPVSLCRANLTEIFRHPYVACEKTDGTRFLLLGASGCLFLLGRKQEVRMLPDSYLPRRDNLRAAQQLTLVDGELVKDRDADGRQIYRFLIYDAVCIEGDTSLREKNLLLRLAAVAERVVAPLRALEEEQKQAQRSPIMQQQHQGSGESSPLNVVAAGDRCSSSSIPVNAKTAAARGAEEERGKNRPQGELQQARNDAPASQQLQVYLKDFFEISDLVHIQRLALRLPHLSDGVIFTPVHLPYATGTCPLLLKWKPPHLNTADFCVNPLYDERGIPRLFQLYMMDRGLLTFKGHFLAPYGKMYRQLLEIASTSRSRLSGMVVECYWHPATPVYTFIPSLRRSCSKDRDFSRRLIEWEKMNGPKPFYDLENGTWKEGGWVVERFRTDKLTPNSSSVINKVLQSIDDGITFTALLREFERYKQHGKKTVRELYLLPPPGGAAAAAVAEAPPRPSERAAAHSWADAAATEATQLSRRAAAATPLV